LKICVDSSLLVSLYVLDSFSTQAAQRMKTAAEFVVTPLNRSELAHALYRYVFRGQIAEFDAGRTWKKFEEDCANGVWSVVGLGESVWIRSVELARRHGSQIGMRTLDSLHVACALELGAERFWAFDARQERLAQAAGLNTNL
jgi:predicted nucleic acid-binding protein